MIDFDKDDFERGRGGGSEAGGDSGRSSTEAKVDNVLKSCVSGSSSFSKACGSKGRSRKEEDRREKSEREQRGEVVKELQKS